jgi:hypothetical protein
VRRTGVATETMLPPPPVRRREFPDKSAGEITERIEEPRSPKCSPRRSDKDEHGVGFIAATASGCMANAAARLHSWWCVPA